MADPEILGRFRELRRTGDTALRDALVEEYAGFAEYLARRYARRGEPFEDLRQVALVGLVNAVERFDPERGSGFTAFAAPTITGEIKRHFRDRTWLVKVPRHIQELSLEVERCRGEFGQRLGRSPTIEEIAAWAGVDEEEVLLSMEAAAAYRLTSLDEGSDETPERGSRHGLGAPDPRLVGAEDRMMVHEVLQRLPMRERRIVHLRYYEGLTQSEIAARMGISQMHVSRLLSKSLGQMASVLRAAS